jgi:hypothetical protein
MTAIKFTSVTDKLLVDGTRRVTLDIEPCDSLAYVTLFGRPGTLGAMSALNLGVESLQNETIAAVKEPTRPLCREAIGYCKEPMFWKWVDKQVDFAVESEIDAKEAMLYQLNNFYAVDGIDPIDSRKKLDEPPWAKLFINIIRDPYREWVKEQAHDFGNSAK